MTDFDFSQINTRSPYGYGPPGGYGARVGRYLDPRQANPYGQGVANVASLFFPAPRATPAQQDAEQALAEQRSMAAAINRAKLVQIADQQTATDQAQRDAAALPAKIVAEKFGLPGQQTVDYLSGATVQPQPETDDEPGIIGGYPTPAPQGLTPGSPREQLIRDYLAGLDLAKNLPGKTNYEQFEGGIGKAGVNEAVSDAGTDPVALALASARSGALQGKDFFKTDASGGTTNVYTGTQDQTSPFAQASTAAKTAQGNASNAAAGASAARAAQTRSETLPQVTVQTPTGPVTVLGKDLSKATATGQNAEALSPDATKQRAWQWLLMGKEAPGWGQSGVAQRNVIANAGTDLGHSLGLSDAEIATLPYDNKTKVKAADNLTRWGAMIEKSSQELLGNIDVALEYAQKMDPSSLRVVNQAIIAGKRQFNDPIQQGYANAMLIAQAHYGRLSAGPLSNAMLPVEMLHRGTDLMNLNVDVPALKEIRSVFSRDAALGVQSVNNTRSALFSSIQNPAARSSGLSPVAPTTAEGGPATIPSVPLASPTAAAPSGIPAGWTVTQH